MLKKGKLYYNIGLVNHYMEKIGLFPMDDIIGGETAYANPKPNHTIHWLKFFTHFWGNIRSEKNNKKLEKVSYEKWKELTSHYEKWQKIDYEAYDLHSLFAKFHNRITYGKENMYLHTDATTASFSKMAILQWKLEKCGYDDSILLNLVTDIDDIKMAKLNTYIWQLKEIFVSVEEEKKVLECLRRENWKEALIESGYLEVHNFITNTILKKYGHRGKNELEIKEPCWLEDSRMLVDMIIDRCETEEIIRNEHSNKDIFHNKDLNELIEQARIFTRLRENNKHYLYYIISDIKRIIRIINKKLRMIVSDMEKDDIYFMEYKEIEALIKDINLFSSIKTKIQERKNIYQEFAKDNETAFVKQVSSQEFHGISACRGVVKGAVKLVNHNNVNEIKKGDIIVMKSLDISFTPLFSIAGGLITELGGILSHAAIVAREYNIPTVVNVEDATRRLKNGDNIILNGETGTICYDQDISN